jgi:lysosomal Pro-X carboxypeptidase
LGHRATIWLNDALSVMSMGNFPYPSGYILNGDGLLPAFPVRAACEHLREDWTGDDQLGDWLSGLASFAGVYYNYSGALDCNTLSAPVNNESSVVDTLWDYQYCSQLFMVGGQGPDEYDLYWDQLWNGTTTADRCRAKYGFLPDREHIALSYGTPNDWSTQASNIVWSQGEYDPWRGGGVQTSLSDSLVAFVIPEAAHHLDLFFSHPNDTQDVIAARRREVAEISRWINEKKERFRSRGFGTTNMVFGME